MTALTIAPWGYTVAGGWLLVAAGVIVFYCGRRFRTLVEDEGPEPELPPDPVYLASLPPEDLDACSRCDGTGAVWPTLDPDDMDLCTACKGNGILPEYLDVAS